MKTMKTIMKHLAELKNAIFVLVTLAGFAFAAGEWTIDHIADEVVERSSATHLKMYRLNRAHDSIRFEMAADLAAKIMVRQDSMLFVLTSINLWQRHTDRRIGQMAKKITADTIRSPYQAELIEIRRLLKEKEASEMRRKETERNMRLFIQRSLEEINRIKTADQKK